MRRPPAKTSNNLLKQPKKTPKVPVGQPDPRFVYRKDAFKKVKIT
jgi:hypothetical protein